MALKTTSSFVRTRRGVFLQPGDLRTFNKSLSVSCKTFTGHISTYHNSWLKGLQKMESKKTVITLVTTTNTGTFSANASPKCSFVIPTMPALAPIYFRKSNSRMNNGTRLTLFSWFHTINIVKSGTCPVIPKTVVFKYFSWPAKSMKVTTWKYQALDLKSNITKNKGKKT